MVAMCPRSGDMEYQLNNTPNRRQLLLLIAERAEAEPHQAESFYLGALKMPDPSQKVTQSGSYSCSCSAQCLPVR
ncbi:hypothetical protein N5P37_005088 [Trichoderma harzianum]|nr:hypothetical protein N5P37_005088 [Trichoderma harzianum]